ncbi:hypothetical protein CVT24_008576 [Panaeolus cyanescens]|uniref:Uncharacterized protein n=1 Tax=Panaeolus cyanescens TaxID=181874 RepID=A0A409VKV5_9AGAR|nr:hypothetical protein CVT24_008576 [Panaeolus cyanescens]
MPSAAASTAPGTWIDITHGSVPNSPSLPPATFPSESMSSSRSSELSRYPSGSTPATQHSATEQAPFSSPSLAGGSSRPSADQHPSFTSPGSPRKKRAAKSMGVTRSPKAIRSAHRAETLSRDPVSGSPSRPNDRPRRGHASMSSDKTRRASSTQSNVNAASFSQTPHAVSGVDPTSSTSGDTEDKFADRVERLTGKRPRTWTTPPPPHIREMYRLHMTLYNPFNDLTAQYSTLPLHPGAHEDENSWSECDAFLQWH